MTGGKVEEHNLDHEVDWLVGECMECGAEVPDEPDYDSAARYYEVFGDDNEA